MARDIPTDLTTATGEVDRGVTHRRNIKDVENAVLDAIVTRDPATAEGRAGGPEVTDVSHEAACTET